MSSPHSTRTAPRILRDLNFDTLLQIVAFLDRRDVESLTRTDKALRNTLASTLLKGHVVVGLPNQESFRAFMSADPIRTSSLRRFTLELLPDESIVTHGSIIQDTHEDPRESIRAVLEIVGTCSNLVSLSLTDIPAFDIPPAALRAVFGFLPQLEDLRLIHITQTYQDTLVGILPSLRSLELSFPSDSLFDPRTDKETHDPLPFTRGHTSTLEKLTLREASLTPQPESLPFRDVRALELRRVFVPDDIRTLIRLFPAIEELATRRLYLSSVAQDQFFSLIDPSSPDVQELVQTARGKYMALSVRERSWPNLRRVTTGNASELYYLGVLCPTGIVHMAISATHSGRLPVGMMTEVLAHLRPRGISCISAADNIWPVFHRSMDYVLNPYLRWSARANARDIVVRWPQQLLKFWRLTTLVSILANNLCSASSTVSSLLLQITARLTPISPPMGTRELPERTSEAHENAEQHMRTLVDRFTPLRHVSIDVEGRGLRAWELMAGEWQELSSSQGHEIWSAKRHTALSFELSP